MTETEHEHEWWYQPPNPNARLFASRAERGSFWYCNVGDHNGSRTPGLDSGCRAVTWERPENWPKTPIHQD